MFAALSETINDTLDVISNTATLFKFQVFQPIISQIPKLNSLQTLLYYGKPITNALSYSELSNCAYRRFQHSFVSPLRLR